jgi:hypothetical protein
VRGDGREGDRYVRRRQVLDILLVWVKVIDKK